MDLIQWAVDNPDKTVEEIMEEFKVSKEVAFYTIKEAAKRI